MKKIMYFLFLALTFASCSRIATADYEVLDYGQIAEINEETGVFNIMSEKDGVKRTWTPELLRDGLSAWAFCYQDSLNVGDNCFVYDDGNHPLLSKVSVADAKIVNRSLSRWFWHELLSPSRLIPLLILAFLVMGFWLLSPNTDEHISMGIFAILVSTLVAVVIMAPGRKLEKVGFGTITAIEKKTR